MLAPIEKIITENIILDSPMDLPQSVLYGVDIDGRTFVLGSHVDLYALLENDYSNIIGLVGIAIHTTGWAAPLNPDSGEVDGPPSEHAERQRIVLVATLTLNGFCSAMKSADRRSGFVLEETTFDETLPSGELWDAMENCMDKVRQVNR